MFACMSGSDDATRLIGNVEAGVAAVRLQFLSIEYEFCQNIVYLYQTPTSEAKATETAATIDPAAEIVKMLLDHGADPNEKTIVST